MVQNLDDLGFRINFKKSVLILCRRIVFFGLIIDTVVFKKILTEEKIDKIISLGKFILQQISITIRCLVYFIGLFVHVLYAVTFGPLYYRGLEINTISALNLNNSDFDSETNISLESENKIAWWVVNLKSVNGKLIRTNHIDCWIETDASLEG